MRRLLDVNGPVPWPAKALVFEVLLRSERWQGVIWRAIRDTTGGYFGRVDVVEALRFIDRLNEPPPGLYAAGLRSALSRRRL